jgi:hypothetical protein
LGFSKKTRVTFRCWILISPGWKWWWNRKFHAEFHFEWSNLINLFGRLSSLPQESIHTNLKSSCNGVCMENVYPKKSLHLSDNHQSWNCSAAASASAATCVWFVCRLPISFHLFSCLLLRGFPSSVLTSPNGRMNMTGGLNLSDPSLLRGFPYP